MRFFCKNSCFTSHVILLSLLPFLIFAQTTTKIKGKIIDDKSREAIPFASVSLLGTKYGTQTDYNGNFYLDIKEPDIRLKISLVGYVSEIRSIEAGKPQTIIIRLKSQINDLAQFTVKGKKERYRNKDNPAVSLIRKVIENKAKNRNEVLDYYRFNKYEKLEFDMSNISEKFKNRRYMRKFDFVFNHLDTSVISGKVNLPMYLKESISDVYFRKFPESKKEIVKAEKLTGLGKYVDNNGIKAYLEMLYQDINVYDNNIYLLSNQFLGPIANLAPQFYQYAIIDTLIFKGVKCVNLGFSPRNKTDMLFQGQLYVSLDADSSFAVRKVQMGFSKDINVNFVTDLRIVQEFDKVNGGGQMLAKDELAIEFNLLKQENGMGLFGRRSVSYKDYEVNNPIDPKIFTGQKTEEILNFDKRDNDFWQSARHQTLSKKEEGIYTMVDSIKGVPSYQRFMNTASFLLEGYKPIGGIEVGPVNTFYGWNTIEGWRVRMGGRTSPIFSERIAFTGYGAYGFGDERWKYFGAATVSLTDHNVYTYPVKSIKISYQQDIKIPGQELQFVNEDNVLLSFKRGVNNKMTYNNVFQLDYLNESKNGFSLNVNFKNIHQVPTGELHFDTVPIDGKTVAIKEIVSSEVLFGLRYAPHEVFYQGKDYRMPIINKYPTFQLRYTVGINNLMGGEYSFQRLNFYATKRFFLSPIGYTDVALEAGKTFGSVPFPLLTIHRANQTYAYQPENYNMMNFMEFISDHYAAIFVDHYFNGFVFNKLPLIKKLKWREIITFKGLWGGISDQNKPTTTNQLYQLPVDANGNLLSFALGNTPYMEASVGIGNIFKILRLDLVKRLTYLDNPNVPKGFALRFRMKFDF